jgi:hypothetical protein
MKTKIHLLVFCLLFSVIFFTVELLAQPKQFPALVVQAIESARQGDKNAVTVALKQIKDSSISLDLTNPQDLMVFQAITPLFFLNGDKEWIDKPKFQIVFFLSAYRHVLCDFFGQLELSTKLI